MNLRILVALCAVLTVFGCGKPSDSGGSTTASGGSAKLKVGMVFDSGGLGDKSFNDSANAGLTKAQTDLGIEPKTVQSASEKDYAVNLEAMASSGCKLVFAVGVAQGDAL